MANKTKFGFGSSENLEQALEQGLLNARDVVLLDEDTDNPKIGWISKSGKPVILVDEKADLTEVEADIEALEAAMAKKARKYEVAKVPEGTLVDYFNKEMRILIKADADFSQDNGVSGAEGVFYIEGRIYAPDGAVKYKVDFGGAITEGNVEDFSGCVDEYGRVYIANALPAAYYDTETAAWVYYGAKSTANHYIGWNQIAYWYDADGMLIGSDSIRVNLSNEDCHYAIEPYYMGEMMTEVNKTIEEKIAEVNSAYTIVEF